MKRILIACLVVVACKDKEAEKTPAPAEAPPPTTAPGTPSARPQRPTLPPEAQHQEQGMPRRERDPAAREERRKEREAMLDTNKDGVVSPEERRERFRPMIGRLDQNNDGKLSVDELGQAKGRLSFQDPKALDTDHNGEISLAELEVAMTARREEMREWRMRGRGGSAGPD